MKAHFERSNRVTGNVIVFQHVENGEGRHGWPFLIRRNLLSTDVLSRERPLIMNEQQESGCR